MENNPKVIKKRPDLGGKYKHWAGCTLNNYSQEDIDWFASVLQPLATYYVVGKEVGEKGTPHLQFMFSLKKPMFLKKMTALFLKTPHIEMKRTKVSMERSSNYCKKGEQSKAEWKKHHEEGKHFGLNADFFEWGELPDDPNTAGGAATKQKYEDAWENASQDKFEEIDAELKIKHYNTLKKVCKEKRKKPATLNHKDEDTPNEWIYGKTGTGKSKRAREGNPDAYIKMMDNEWWDDYANEDVAIIEDMSIYHKKQGDHLKLWADRYPFRANQKFAGELIRPRKIIITSNYTIREIWPDETTFEPLERRFKSICLDKPTANAVALSKPVRMIEGGFIIGDMPEEVSAWVKSTMRVDHIEDEMELPPIVEHSEEEYDENLYDFIPNHEKNPALYQDEFSDPIFQL